MFIGEGKYLLGEPMSYAKADRNGWSWFPPAAPGPGRVVGGDAPEPL